MALNGRNLHNNRKGERVIDPSRLGRIHQKADGSIIARCPACAEEGGDSKGKHLKIESDGVTFSCIRFPGEQGMAHRRRILDLIGTRIEVDAGPIRSAPRCEKSRRVFTPEALEKLIARVESQLTGFYKSSVYKYGEGFCVVRFEFGPEEKREKTFRQFSKHGDGWIPEGPRENIPLFNLAALQERKLDRVLLVEGEKCCLCASLLNMLATTAAGGAYAPIEKTDFSPLADREVIILADNDDPGRAYSQKVCAHLKQLSPPARVSVIASLPGCDEVGADLADWIHKGNGLGRSSEDLRAELDSIILAVTESSKPRLRSLMDIAAGPRDPRETILGERFLCVGGGMLFIGPSGIGKSSASAQQDILWALGKEAFGIRPQRPLKILTIQAENDDIDIEEMREGVLRGLSLSKAEREKLRNQVFYERDDTRRGLEFLARVDQLLALDQFDLLRIDPFLAYLGGDIQNTELTGTFLREQLNPILARHKVGAIINHHTPKTNNRDTSNYRASDWAYAGAGGHDIVNWARAAVIIDPTHASHVFRFIAAKRGARIGWRDEYGEKEIIRHYCHADDGLYWREATQSDLDAVAEAVKAKKNGCSVATPDDLMGLVPVTGTIPKKLLLEEAVRKGFGKHRSDGLLKDLLKKESLHLWRIPRSGTNPEPVICRLPQPVFGQR